MNKSKSNFREMISGGNGIISSKRVMGVVILSVCMLCTIWLVVREGGTQVVENLLQTLMIMAAALLGISSVTNIWKKGRAGETAKTLEAAGVIENTGTTVETQFDPDNPCKNCMYNKKEETI